MPEQAMVPLPGSERQEQPGATRIGPVPDDETIQFSVVVRARQGAPDMEEVARNASITGEFLSREELAAATAPDPADVQAVEEYAHRNGLTVEQVDPVTRRVKLAGSAAAVKQAFGVSLDRYELGSRTFRGRTGPVLVPESLADVVVGVLGTDDRPMAHRLATLAPQFTSGTSVPMTAVQIASYYNYPADLDGTGQCIGIIEFGGGYLIQDINAYFSGLGLKTPPIVDVPVDGGSNTPTPGTGPTPNDYTVEVEADIEIAGSAAPGASLAVYFVGNDSTNNLLDAVNAAIGDTANNPSVLSISYGTAEDSNPPQNIAPVNLAFASAGAVGITVLIASGDNGSMGRWQQGPPDALAHVNFAASSPNATGVGGTVLQPNGSGGVAAEVVWNNNATTSASGGGVSNYFNTVPTFQSGAGINPVSANPPGNTGRGVPDVSANADSYQVYIRGQNASFTGTSAATPLWAGLFARVNQGIGGRAGLPLATLYGPLLTAGALNDITTGDNGAYTAGPGWDACTGLGSPNGTAILTGWRTARQVAPTVTGLSESSGSAGDQLVITGTGFLGATAVNFSTVTAGLLAPMNDGTVNSDTQITVTVPSGPASGTTVDVTVTAPGGTSADVSADQFTFN